MTDNAEMGERPADPATRAGIGVGAGTDDFVEGAAEEQFETEGSAPDSTWHNTGPADANGVPENARGSFADTDALASRMNPVDEWGTGERELPQQGPSEELDSDV